MMICSCHGDICTSVYTFVSLPTGFTAGQANIMQLRQHFDSLKSEQELERAQVSVESLLDTLNDRPAAVGDIH